MRRIVLVAWSVCSACGPLVVDPPADAGGETGGSTDSLDEVSTTGDSVGSETADGATGSEEDSTGSVPPDAPDVPEECPSWGCTSCGDPDVWYCLRDAECPAGLLPELDWARRGEDDCFAGCIPAAECDLRSRCECAPGLVCTHEHDPQTCGWFGIACRPPPPGCDPDVDPQCLCEACTEPDACELRPTESAWPELDCRCTP